MDIISEENLSARLDACLGATLQEMWEAFGSVLHRDTGQGVDLIFLLVLSVLFGATNGAQTHQLLGLKGQPLYKRVAGCCPSCLGHPHGRGACTSEEEDFLFNTREVKT